MENAQYVHLVHIKMKLVNHTAKGDVHLIIKFWLVQVKPHKIVYVLQDMDGMDQVVMHVG